MRKSLLWISILAVLIASIPLANIGTVSSSTVGWIEGTVTDPLTGSPLVGATVTADGHANTTDENGNYTIEVEAGTYNVTASAEGYWDKVVKNVNVTASITIIVNFTLSKAVISVDPPIKSGSANANFMVNVTITDVFNLYMWEVHISFDPDVLECTGVLEGPFLKSAGSTSWSMMQPNIDNVAGTIKATDFLKYYPPQGATGNGTLCTINFKVEVEGKTPLHFYKKELWTYDGMVLVPIELGVEDGLFWFPGDADINGLADMYDFYMWREYFGKTTGEWPSDVNPDFNGDMLVDIEDFYLWRENFGKT